MVFAAVALGLVLAPMRAWPVPEQASMYRKAAETYRAAAAKCPAESGCYNAMAAYHDCLANELGGGGKCTAPTCKPANCNMDGGAPPQAALGPSGTGSTHPAVAAVNTLAGAVMDRIAAQQARWANEKAQSFAQGQAMQAQDREDMAAVDAHMASVNAELGPALAQIKPNDTPIPMLQAQFKEMVENKAYTYMTRSVKVIRGNIIPTFLDWDEVTSNYGPAQVDGCKIKVPATHTSRQRSANIEQVTNWKSFGDPLKIPVHVDFGTVKPANIRVYAASERMRPRVCSLDISGGIGTTTTSGAAGYYVVGEEPDKGKVCPMWGGIVFNDESTARNAAMLMARLAVNCQARAGTLAPPAPAPAPSAIPASQTPAPQASAPKASPAQAPTPPATPSDAAALVGTYDLTGMAPNRSAYAGRLTITPLRAALQAEPSVRSEGFALHWQLGNNSFDGVGLLGPLGLAVAYGWQGSANTCKVWQLTGTEPTMTGRWLRAPDGSQGAVTLDASAWLPANPAASPAAPGVDAKALIKRLKLPDGTVGVGVKFGEELAVASPEKDCGVGWYKLVNDQLVGFWVADQPAVGLETGKRLPGR